MLPINDYTLEPVEQSNLLPHLCHFRVMFVTNQSVCVFLEEQHLINRGLFNGLTKMWLVSILEWKGDPILWRHAACGA